MNSSQAFPDSAYGLTLPFAPAGPGPEEVRTLIKKWFQAIRQSFHRAYFPTRFYSPTPWVSADSKERDRWDGFAQLARSLREWGADPAEFCTAVAEHHKRWNTGKHPRIPNARQCSGEWGKNIWEEWRRLRLAEGYGSQYRLQGAKILGTRTERDDIVEGLAAALGEIRREGIDGAITLDWGADVLWVLWRTEPEMREAIVLRLRLSEAVDLREAVRRGLEKINGNPSRQLWLLRIRNETVKTPHPVVAGERGNA